MEKLQHFHEHLIFKSPKHLVKVLIDKEINPIYHDHNFYELIVVTQGRGTHKIGSSIVPVNRGDVFAIPPDIAHSFLDKENLEIMNILFKTEFIQKRKHKSKSFPGYLKLMEIEPFLRQNYDYSMFLHLNSTQLEEIQRDIKFIDDANNIYNIENFELQYHTAWRIIYYLSYLLEEQFKKNIIKVSSKYETQLLETLEYIHQNFSNKISVEELAGRIFLSRSTFLRHFQTVCGCSPTQYLCQYRAKKAEELLENSTMSKTEMAHACGFYDLSHMEKYIRTNRTTIHG